MGAIYNNCIKLPKEIKIEDSDEEYIYMKRANLINEILVSIEKLIKNIRTLYSNIKESFKKEKNVTI